MTAGSRLDGIRYSRTWAHRIGGITFCLARLARDAASTPSVYAAALNEDDLHGRHGRRGYGATEAEAVAALLNFISD